MAIKYHITSRIIHWVMALIIIGLLASGVFMVNFLESTDSSRGNFYNLHKSFGVIVLILIFLRIFNKIINRPPALPGTIHKHERILAYIGHHLLYLSMLLMPFSGYLMSNSYGYSVKLFSISLPNLVEKNYEIAGIFASTHQYLGYFTIALLAFHISGTLKHKYLDKNKENDVLKRMI